MFTILEVAILAAVIVNRPEPFFCRLREEGGVFCSHGVGATLLAEDKLRFSDFTEVVRGENGGYRFSNGITAWHSAAGGVRFSTGVTVRRRSYNTFDFSNGLSCHSASRDSAICERFSGARQ